MLPNYEEVKEQMLPLKGFSQYEVHVKLGKIYNLKSNKWMLVNSVGVGDKGYLLTKLKHDSGVMLPIYEHEAVVAADKNVEPKSWRAEGKEIDHIDGNAKNNSIDNLSLGTSADNKKNRSYDMEKNMLSLDAANFIREEFAMWQGNKTDFYKLYAGRFNVCPRTIQNAVLKITYNRKPRLTYQVDASGVVHNVRPEVN